MEIENHETNSKIHRDLVKLMKTSERIALEDLSLYLNGKIEAKNAITARVFRTVYVGVNSIGCSINSMPVMLQLMKSHHTELGKCVNMWYVQFFSKYVCK